MQTQSVHHAVVANNTQIGSANQGIQGTIQNQVVQTGNVIYDPNLKPIQQPLREHSISQPQPVYAQTIYTHPTQTQTPTQYVQVQPRPQVINQGYVQYGQIQGQQQLANPVYVQQQVHQVAGQQPKPNPAGNYILATPIQQKNQIQSY